MSNTTPIIVTDYDVHTEHSRDLAENSNPVANKPDEEPQQESTPVVERKASLVRRGSSYFIKKLRPSSLNLVHEKENHSVYDFYYEIDIIGQGSISRISLITPKNSFERRVKQLISDRQNNFDIDSSTKTIRKGKKRGKAYCLQCCVDCFAFDPAYECQNCFALKTIFTCLLTEANLQEMRNEIDILRSLDHPNIVKAYEVFYRSQHIDLVLELCSGGDLYQRSPYDEKNASSIMKKLLSAVAYMHTKNIVHRDLKFENIMFENDSPNAEVKIIDFGLSVKYIDPQKRLTDRVGTAYTMAPEVILRRPYSFPADIFSLGVIAYILCTDRKPFWGKSKDECRKRIVQGKPDFSESVWGEISGNAREFTKTLLSAKPEDRPPALQALEHAWIRSHEVHDSRYLERRISETTYHAVKDNILKYTHRSDFQKLVLNLVAHDSSSNDIAKLRELFIACDRNKDGTISYEDFKCAFKNTNIADEMLDDAFKNSSVFKNNETIQYTEFLAATLEIQHRVQEEELAKVFLKLEDSNNKGYISKENLREVFTNNTEDNYLVDDIMKEVDGDGDGLISYPEFVHAFRREKRRRLSEIGLVQNQYSSIIVDNLSMSIQDALTISDESI